MNYDFDVHPIWEEYFYFFQTKLSEKTKWLAVYRYAVVDGVGVAVQVVVSR